MGYFGLGKKPEVEKGDVQGHPFHGNQYTMTAVAASEVADHAARNAADKRELHMNAMTAHRNASSRTKDNNTRNYHNARAVYHAKAAERARISLDVGNKTKQDVVLAASRTAGARDRAMGMSRQGLTSGPGAHAPPVRGVPVAVSDNPQDIQKED